MRRPGTSHAQIYQFHAGGRRERIFTRPHWLPLSQCDQDRNRIRSANWRSSRTSVGTCKVEITVSVAREGQGGAAGDKLDSAVRRCRSKRGRGTSSPFGRSTEARG